MKRSPIELLFERRFSDANEKVGSPLFNNRNELVLLMKDPKYQKYFIKKRNENSIRVDVYGLFKGELEKKSSQETLNVLVKIIIDRLILRAIPHHETILNEILVSFGELSDTHSFNLKLSFPILFKVREEHRTFNYYTEDLLKAEKVVVVTREPSELLLNGDDCTNAISELTIYTICRYFIFNSRIPKFEYYFPKNDNIEDKFWRKLRDLLVNKIKTDDYLLHQFISYRDPQGMRNSLFDVEYEVTKFFVECIDQSLISVKSVTDPKVFLINLTMFDPDDDLSSKGYFHRTSENNRINQISDSDRLYWIKEVWFSKDINGLAGAISNYEFALENGKYYLKNKTSQRAALTSMIESAV